MTSPILGHTLNKNTFVGTPKINGGIWLVPQTIELPTDVASARPTGCIRLGGVSEDGYTYTSERKTDQVKDWNGQKIRSLQTAMDDMFEVTFIEFLNPDLLGVLYGSDNVTVAPATASKGTLITVRHAVDQLEHGAYIIDTFDGKVKRRRVVPDAQPSKVDPIVERPGEMSVYKVTFDIFPDSQGYTSYTYTDLGDPTAALPAPSDADAKAAANKAAAEQAATDKALAADKASAK